MPRVPRFPPYPKRPHSSGQARIKLRGEPVYLGLHGSPASYAEYERRLSLWRSARAAAETPGASHAPGPATAQVRAVGELVARFWEHAKRYYRRADGTEKDELQHFWYALRPLTLFFARTPVADFKARALREARAFLVQGYDDPERGRTRPCSRRVANRHVVRIRTVFRWAEGEELIPEGKYQHLRSVRGLPKLEPGVVDHDDVPPAPEADVEAALAVVNPVVRALARVQLLTGARPSELTRLRPADLVKLDRVELRPGLALDATGLWVYLPREHKTAHLGHRRVILFGPLAQAELRPLLEGRDPGDFVFCPRDACRLRLEGLAAARRAKGLPDPVSRAVARRDRPPGARYSGDSYRQAIVTACDRAGVPHWHPYQLRHNAASRLTSQFGPEVARIVLGHRTLDTTRRYVEDDLSKGARAMGETG